jgi:hypothetical protein
MAVELSRVESDGMDVLVGWLGYEPPEHGETWMARLDVSEENLQTESASPHRRTLWIHLLQLKSGMIKTSGI